MVDRTNVAYSDGYHLHFSSVDRQSGTASDFTIACSIPIPPSGLDFNRLAVVDLALPKSWYLVVAPFNTFQLVEKKVAVTVTVPPGNYNLQQWITQVPVIITAASPNNWVYTATRVTVPDLGVALYTVAGSGGLQPSFIVNAGGDLSQQLGFATGTWTFASNSLQGTIPYNGTGDFGVRLRSDLGEAEGDQTIADVMDCGLSPPGSIIRFQLQECLAQTKRFHRTGSTAFRFWLVSATSGRPIDTNGLPLTCHIKIYRLEDNAIWVEKAMLDQLKVMTTALGELKTALEKPPPLPIGGLPSVSLPLPIEPPMIKVDEPPPIETGTPEVDPRAGEQQGGRRLSSDDGEVI